MYQSIYWCYHLYKIEFCQPNTSCIFIYSSLLIPQLKFIVSEYISLKYISVFVAIWVWIFFLYYSLTCYFSYRKTPILYISFLIVIYHLLFSLNCLDFSYHLKIIIILPLLSNFILYLFLLAICIGWFWPQKMVE